MIKISSTYNVSKQTNLLYLLYLPNRHLLVIYFLKPMLLKTVKLPYTTFFLLA